MEKKSYFRKNKDQKYTEEQMKYILVGLKQAKAILIGYVMLPE